jgi:amino acid adenylation domain-containing protein
LTEGLEVGAELSRADGQLASETQRAFWALSSVAPDRAIAVEGLVLELRGPLSAPHLRLAFDLLEHRHASFRTWLEDRDGVLVTRIGAPQGGLLREVERAVSEPERRAALDELVRAGMAEPFDLGRAPLVRATLVRFDDTHHALFVVMHHTITDGTSLLVAFPRQLEALYLGLVEQREPTATTSGILRRPEAVVRGDDEVARAFWTRELADAPRALELPTDHRRPPVRSLRGARIEASLDGSEREALVRAARALEAHPLDVCLAACALMGARLAETSEVVLGTAHANRRGAIDAEALGCHVLNVPIRCEVGASSSFAELVGRIQARRRAAFAHRSSVIDDVLSTRAPEPGRNPGYQLALNYMPFSERSLTFGPLEVKAWRPDPGWTATDLAFDVIEDPIGLRVVLERDLALFEEVTARAWLDAFVSLLRRAETLVDAPLADIELVDESARAALVALGDGGGPPARESLMHEEVRARVRARPEAIALVHGDRAMSYDTLWKRACALAHRLVAVPDGESPRLVGVSVEDPIEAVVAMLGTLLSGAGYIPLDPALPPARLARKLHDGKPVAVITDGRAIEGVPNVAIEATFADEPPLIAIDPSSPAYVIFTSGSTGHPKGVAVRHRNVVHQLDARRAVYGSAPQRTLVAHAFAFDSAVANLYWALANGGTLVLCDEDERRDPEQLRHAIEHGRVELIDVPPALYHELLRAGAHGLGSLRVVVVGGEVVPPSLARMHRALLPDARLVDEYGPTETTVFSTYHVVDRDDDETIPIGRPIERTRCYVVDDAGRLALRGAIGELWIGGAGVTAGYLRRDDLTRERFVRFQDEPVYRTGDRVRWLASGELAFHGRMDAQVQVRGHRVELGEIVAALEAQASVERAVVVARDRGGMVLDAYVTTRESALDVAALRNALRSELPEVMVPSTITVVASFPRAESGKIDEASLPPPAPPSVSRTGPMSWRNEVRTQTEDHIAAAFRRVLRLDEVGVHDSFFDLGGSSLSAVRVLATLQRELGTRVPLDVFVRVPTVAGLAERLHELGTVEEERQVVKIREGGPDREPFWLVHPVGGHVVFAHRIAERWKPEQPLYGIQARGLDGRHPPITSMDEMAERYVELMVAEQPKGPYYLGGPSQGGLVALEIAQRLRRRGADVAMLVMFDCWAPGWPRYLGPTRQALDHVAALRPLPWRARVEYVRERVERRVRRQGPAWLRYEGAEHLEGGELRDALLEVQRANERLADAYVARPYPGVIHVFRALRTFESPGYRFDDPSCGWAALARGVVTDEIDAAHHDMLDHPGVDEVARKLERRIEAVRALRARQP